MLAEVWSESFGDKLALRQISQHRKCSTCCKHKALLKKLANDRFGRQLQLSQYAAHLRGQYADRVCYWNARSASRLVLSSHGLKTCCIFIDGMDHSKFRFPRSAVTGSSKQFANFVRPHVDTHLCLIHGFMTLLAQSPPWVSKNSNFCIELILHCLHRINSHTDCRGVELVVQSDNTSKEVKNNGSLRMASLLVSRHKVARCEFRMLLSGHSHEDGDALFGAITYHLERCSELHTPHDFVAALRRFLANPKTRPDEPYHDVVEVHQVRDWTFRCVQSQLICYFLLARLLTLTNFP